MYQLWGTVTSRSGSKSLWLYQTGIFPSAVKYFILIFYSEFNTQNVSWDIISFSGFIYFPENMEIFAL